MKKKLTFFMFSLLLAVGWTNDASAQALPGAKAKSTTFDFSAPSRMVTHNHQSAATAVEEMPEGMSENTRFRAPLRSNNYTVTANVVHPKAWYDQYYFTYYDGNNTQQSANFTDPASDPYQIMALLKLIYTESLFPGIKYSEAKGKDVEYQTILHGWDIIGNNYEPLTITTNNYDTYIRYIAVRDSADNVIVSWTPSTDGTTLPSGWSCNANMRTYSYGDYTGVYMGTSTTGGTITINPSSFVNNAPGGYVRLVIRYAAEAATTMLVNGSETDVTTEWQGTVWTVPGTISTPPDENGYTVLLVKLKDGINEETTDRAPMYTSNASELRDYFSTYVDEVQLLTDGLRVDEGTSNAGTVFAYTGDLNKFFYIGKGKMAFMTSVRETGERAPFYGMYEEFSPDFQSNTSGFDDFYEKMKQGVTYPIIHDCNSVIYMQHYFSMAGKKGSTKNRVNSLVLYIPDERGQMADGSAWRDYETNHQPTVGMYMIDLYADIEPSATQTDYYTVTVNWYDNLDALTHSDNIPQTYTLYEIMDHDNDGVVDTIPVYTGPATTYQNDFPVGDPRYYDISYYVIGTPTQATNQDTFFAISNTDDVTVPGKTDFIGLQWWRYESDYVTDDDTNQEVNYYRNFLAPHALSVQGEAGINAGNVGTTGRTLTLYRDETPIFDLELVMKGNKAYFRIKHINREENQQVEPGYDPNTGERTRTNNN